MGLESWVIFNWYSHSLVVKIGFCKSLRQSNLLDAELKVQARTYGDIHRAWNPDLPRILHAAWFIPKFLLSYISAGFFSLFLYNIRISFLKGNHVNSSAWPQTPALLYLLQSAGVISVRSKTVYSSQTLLWWPINLHLLSVMCSHCFALIHWGFGSLFSFIHYFHL